MGCTSSKVDSEDTVRRCRERRRLMKETVHSRHHFAAAHSDYIRALRLTGSALSAFAKFQGQLSVSPDLAGPVLLPHPDVARQMASPAAAAAAASRHFEAPVADPAPKVSPVPPSPAFDGYKLPHILSESSPTATPEIEERRSRTSKRRMSVKYPYLPENSTYAATPSQVSSTWDWEKFYPPSPPTSEYFDRLQKEARQERDGNGDSSDDDELHRDHHLPKDRHYEDDNENDGGDRLHRHEEQEEVRCSGWRDYFSTSSGSSVKSAGISDRGDLMDYDDDDDDARSEVISATRSDLESSMDQHQWHSRLNHHARRSLPSEFASSTATGISGLREGTGMSTTTSSEGPESSIRRGSAVNDSVLKLVVRHRDLKEIVAAIDEYFAKAVTAGEGGSDLLETGKAQFERSFRQLKKTVYHSNSVLSSLSATLTSKPPLAIRYRLDAAALEDPPNGGDGEKTSHCSTLERLLTWEKKLYKEVKDREGVKIEHERKLSTLQSLERRGRVDERMEKTRASIARLQSQIIVTSQAASTTSSAIIRVRDNELAPQLLRLCSGFAIMWRTMNQLHEAQTQIVQQVRGLVNRSAAVDPTSALLRQATKDLESAAATWHSSFSRLVKHHRDYIRSLHAWLKLTQFAVAGAGAGEEDHFSSLVSAELAAFCEDWKAALDRVPDTVAGEAIKSFATVVHTIFLKQSEELKIRKKAEALSKELEKKTFALRAIEKKYYQSYSMVGIGIMDGGGAADPLADKRAEIAVWRRKVEEETARQVNAAKVTREMTLNSIQTGLPGMFQAITGFSGLLADALEGVSRRHRQG